MAKRSIITLPDPMLRAPSASVERVDQDLQRLIDDMLETMYAAPGIGLAAVQVAVPLRVLVYDITRDETAPRNPHAMINPEILATGEALRVHEEGCLSIPEFYAEVERPADITVRYLDRTGTQRDERFEGVLATVIQHEIDHLNGVLFIDYLSRLKRNMVVRRFVKAKRSEGLV